MLAELPPASRVLELGAGSGFQSTWLTTLGHSVEAVDVDDTGDTFPVKVYDGVHIPFPDGAFDVVFSSNVLEHVHDLPGLLADVHRVLAPGGRMVSILPSSTWRLWTAVAHYPFLAKFALTRRLPTPSRVRETSSTEKLSKWQIVSRALFPRAHGEFPSALHELVTFRRAWWKAQMGDAGFVVERVRSLGLFYTGYSLFEGASLATRRRASRLLGSSTYVIVAKPTAE